MKTFGFTRFSCYNFVDINIKSSVIKLYFSAHINQITKLKKKIVIACSPKKKKKKNTNNKAPYVLHAHCPARTFYFSTDLEQPMTKVPS